MTTKDLFMKQVIISINNINKKNFMEKSSVHITNLNRALKNNKIEVIVDFVRSNSRGIIIMTNKVTSSSDLQMIKNYVKNTECINTNRVEVLRLLQSKFNSKIINIPYLQENIITPITSSMVKDIIKKNHIFNKIALASKPHIIKVSSKLNMAIILVDI